MEYTIKVLLRSKCKVLLVFCILIINTAFNQNWQSVGNGFNREVEGLFTDSINNKLYAYGLFDTINSGIPVNEAAVLNGGTWDSVSFINGYFVARQFTSHGGSILFGGRPVMEWDGNQLDTFAVCSNGGVVGFAKFQGDLVAYGSFDTINGVAASKVAIFDGITWAPFDTIRWGSGAVISCAIEYKGSIYCGGSINGFVPNGFIDRLARWDGSEWHPVGNNELGGGLGGISAFEIYQGDLWITGLFNQVFGNPYNGIARWDGSAWKDPMGGTSTPTSQVFDMEVFNNELYICGNFTSVAGMPVAGIAKWDGYQWCGLSFNNIQPAWGHPTCMAVYNNELYIGGTFKVIDADTMNYITKWIGGNYTDTCGIQVSVDEEMSLEQIRIYPNPTSGLVTIANLPPVAEAAISVVNLQGQVVYERAAPAASSSDLEIDLGNLPSGMYWVQVITKDHVITKKLVKAD